MVFDKMAAICPDFKWLGFRISDHLQPNLFSTIEKSDKSGFQIITVGELAPFAYKVELKDLETFRMNQKGHYNWASGIQISFQTQDHLTTNLFWTIQNPDTTDFRSPQ